MGMDRLGPPVKSRTYTPSFYGTTVADKKLLTASAVAGVAVDIKRASSITAIVRYLKGDETTARVRLMVAKGDTAPADEAEWFPAGELGAASSGVRALTKGEVSLTPASFAADDKVAFEMEIRSWDWVRADCYAVGGTPTGTLWVAIAGGWGM
jgi:hypothetical protein